MGLVLASSSVHLPPWKGTHLSEYLQHCEETGVFLFVAHQSECQQTISLYKFYCRWPRGKINLSKRLRRSLKIIVRSSFCQDKYTSTTQSDMCCIFGRIRVLPGLLQQCKACQHVHGTDQGVHPACFTPLVETEGHKRTQRSSSPSPCPKAGLTTGRSRLTDVCLTCSHNDGNSTTAADNLCLVFSVLIARNLSFPAL